MEIYCRMIFEDWTEKDIVHRNLFNFYFEIIWERRCRANDNIFFIIAKLRSDIIARYEQTYAGYFYDKDNIIPEVIGGRMNLFDTDDFDIAKFKADLYLSDLGHELVNPFWDTKK